jgi:hypothetical protein
MPDLSDAETTMRDADALHLAPRYMGEPIRSRSMYATFLARGSRFGAMPFSAITDVHDGTVWCDGTTLRRLMEWKGFF